MPPDDNDSGEIIDFRALRNWWFFAGGSLRRHKWAVLVVVFSVVGLAALALAVMPKTYHVEARLLAQRNQVLAIRGDQPGGDAPTKVPARSP